MLNRWLCCINDSCHLITYYYFWRKLPTVTCGLGTGRVTDDENSCLPLLKLNSSFYFLFVHHPFGHVCPFSQPINTFSFSIFHYFCFCPVCPFRYFTTVALLPSCPFLCCFFPMCLLSFQLFFLFLISSLYLLPFLSFFVFSSILLLSFAVLCIF